MSTPRFPTRTKELLPLALLACFLATPTLAQAPSLPGEVVASRMITEGVSGFSSALSDFDNFGVSTVGVGDLDGDGIPDVATGASSDADGGAYRGAVWVFFLNADGSVRAEQKISATQGGFGGALSNGDGLGYSLASLGDLDGDGVGDLAVGAVGDDGLGADRGAVWVLFMNQDGTVKGQQKIGDNVGGFTGVLHDVDFFGYSIASLGDLDGDAVSDIVVGARGDDDGGGWRGAAWILFLNTDGTVKAQQKISSTEGGFGGDLDDLDGFGWSVAGLGDLDEDGTPDLAVGAVGDDDGGVDRGSLFVLFLNADGTVKAHQKINDGEGGFAGGLDDEDYFGWSVTSLGDLDGDLITDLAVGAARDDDGGLDRGAVYVLFLNTDGTVRDHQKISDTTGGLAGQRSDDDLFGWSVSSLGDVDGDGVTDLTVGAPHHGNTNRGSFWVLFMNAARWYDLGLGMPGTHGVPTLEGQGTLVADSTTTLMLNRALQNTGAWIVIGRTASPKPFMGGVLVPSIDTVLFGVPTGQPVGKLELSGRWAFGVVADFPTYYQAWIADPAGPMGFVSSNALMSVSP